MKTFKVSIAKPGQGQVNEDAAIANEHMIAVSDGAGGGGIYAERWSQYLVDHLPQKPLCSFNELDNWVDGIWEPFYDECEKLAKQEGGMVLNKFYDEGSFATLAAIWIDGNKAQWATYGDSVAFCYNPATDELEHSFTKLADFNNPPFLINYNNELQSKGFRCGAFKVENCCLLFCTSDALAHYILMMYEVAHRDKFSIELSEAENVESRLSSYVKAAESLSFDFHSDVLMKLMHCRSEYLFERHLKRLIKNRLIALDDYSLAMGVV